ncbi:hypothetical protein N7454_010434 [Penicillium verhagenii]|nr:hypothetical protein N7454_010434 [Penicillium verhagenii]
MSNKAALKAIRAAIDARKFDIAREKALDLVKEDAKDYYANVYLGLANDKLRKLQDAETAYLAATRIKPEEPTAWQGLIGLYDKQGSAKLDAYHDAALALGLVFAERQGKVDLCQEVINKYITLAKRCGSIAQKKKCLEIQLPTSPVYDILEGRLHHPSLTYLRLIELAEPEEKEYINREIGERRTRLGARIEKVTMEVKREAFKNSELAKLYAGMIQWSNDDAVRRQYEEKLLQRAYDELEVIPVKAKRSKRNEIIKAAQDMVIIKHPFELAWKIFLEWKDVTDYSEWDVGVVREFIEFFPETGLAKVLKGFLASDLSPFPPEETTEPEKEPADASGSDLMSVSLMAEGLDLARSSVVAHRIMADVYFSMGEHATTVEVARKGLLNAQELAQLTTLNLINTQDSLNIKLANSLISHQSPRHHPEAKKIFEDILQRKPTSTNCLLGIGLISKVDENYPEAVDFLERALKRDPSNILVQGELSWCKALTGDFETGLNGLQEALECFEKEKESNTEFRSELHYRIGYCQWELDPSPAARMNRKGAYASFLSSIQLNMNFAPAYTSLGLYYADYKGDKTRARRCFHKAFELSLSEIEAAERLARGFADQKEWDLVEAISQRVVDSGKAKPAPGSKRKGHSWPFAALGTVQINKQQYSKSIVSFQAALRISASDYHSWVGLAESYHHSGRYIAATRAFEHAKALEETLSSEEKEHVWFARYMLANVKRELGEYDAAITDYEDILSTRPNDVGNTVALLQTLAESSWKSLHSGLFNDAAELANKTIQVAHSLAAVRSDIFNLWKAVGDACATFSYIKKKADKMSFTTCMTLLNAQLDPAALEIMSDVDGVGHEWLNSSSESAVSSDTCIYMAILAHKRAMHVSANDQHAQAVGWYNLGWAEFRAYRTVQPVSGNKEKKSRKFLKAAMQCFKRAIELEAGNSDFWNALGVVTTSLSPKVAQHSFVRSLHLNERSAQVWTNLGALYLLHNDYSLANEAFTRGQSIDPDYSQAWVGQGFVALLFGEAKEARGLFAHAFDISNSFDMLPKRQFSLTLFDHLLSDSSVSNEVSQLIQPFFALHQLCIQDPFDLPFMHISALLAERMGETADAESSLEIVCTGMEAEYEESESLKSLSNFAQANADFARVLLARHEYEQAADKAETALSLSGEEDAGGFDPETRTKLRLSAHLTAGLAYYFTQSMDRAIDMFRDALIEASNTPNVPDVVCLLVQVLWAKGGKEEKEVARQQLDDCIKDHPDHIGVTSLFGAIAIVDGDKACIEALESDLRNKVCRDGIDMHDRAKLLKLLAAISTLGLNKDGASLLPEPLRQIKEATSAIMMCPGQPQGWLELSEVSESAHPAEMAISRALRCAPPHGNIDATDLSMAYAQTGKVGDTFRSIMISPWRQDGWESLNCALKNWA